MSRFPAGLRSFSCAPAALLLFLILPYAQAQTGIPPFSDIKGGLNEANLNVYLSMPILGKAGRGLPFNYNLQFNSTVWSNVGTAWQPIPNGEGFNLFGFDIGPQNIVGYITRQNIGCSGRQDWTNYAFHEPNGTVHKFPNLEWSAYCNIFVADDTASDGSGFKMHLISPTDGIVTSPSGVVFSTHTYISSGSVVDTNGNTISYTVGAPSACAHPGAGYGCDLFTDTLGLQALDISTGASYPRYYTYTSPSGSSVAATVTTVTYTVQTNFGCTGVAEYPATNLSLVDRVTLADGSFYAFTYEPTPSFPGRVTGRIASIRYPTGATVSYSYTGGNGGVVCADGTAAGLTITTSDGGTWTYSRAGSGSAWTTTIADPAGNQTVANFENVSTATSGMYETQRVIYQGALGAQVLANIATCYNGNTANCNSTPITLPITRRTITTQIGSFTSKRDLFYSSPGLLTEDDEYDFGGSSPVRKTVITYAALGNNISDRPSQITVEDGATSPNIKAQTTISYDQTAVTATSGTPQLAAVTGSRGNPTTISYLVQGSTTVSRTLSYFDTGLVQSATDFKSNSTTNSYGNCGNSLLSSVSLPLSLSRSMVWNCTGGVLSSTTDENGQATSYSYGDPNFWRVTQVSSPDGGQTNLTYNSVNVPWNIVRSAKLNSTQNLTAETVFDSQGRVSQQQLTSDPEGITYTDTTYDAAGRLHSVSNPYRKTTDATYGAMSYAYDGLNRTTLQTQPDGNTIAISYSSNCTTATDEAGKQRKGCVDGLGRTTAVFEPDGTGALTWETDYQYDLLNNVTSVTQKGGSTDSTQWRVRTYAYDGLSRLTQQSTPEGGTTTYSFSTTSGLCSGDASQPCSRSDARGITTTYTYDAWNRPVSKTYSDSTPAVSYFYDQTSYNGLTISNGKGRRTGMSDGSGQTAWSYDAMGRVLKEQRTITGYSKTFSFTYNLDGSPATITYPSGRVVTYGYSTAGRQVSAKDIANGINYALNATYWPTGQLFAVVTGNDGGNAGTTLTQSFNNRLQVTSIQATSPFQSLLNLSYTWVDGSNHNNSMLQQETNNLDNTRNQAYSYDQLNRLVNAHSPSTWGDAYVYDPWANLLQKNVTQGTAENLSVLVDAHNHMLGAFSYDNAGNEVNDSSHSFAFDAEARITTGNTATYTYDGDSLRVKKIDTATPASNRLYWRGGGLTVLTESDTAGNLQKDFIFFAGRRIAYYSYSSGNKHYFYHDQLGSVRVIGNTSGSTIEWSADYYPWGMIQKQPVNALDNRYQFADQEWDPEDWHYYLTFRYYAPVHARFMSPDPVGGDIANPQSLNRYAYVQNNPMNFIDPLGLCDNFVVTPNPDGSGGFIGRCADPSGSALPNPCGGLFFCGGMSNWVHQRMLDLRDDFFPLQRLGNRLGDITDNVLAFFQTQRRPGESFLDCVSRLTSIVSAAGLVDVAAGTNLRSDPIVDAFTGNDVASAANILFGSNAQRFDAATSTGLAEGSTRGLKAGLATPTQTLVTISGAKRPVLSRAGSKVVGTALETINKVKRAADVGAFIGASASCINPAP